MTTNESRLDRIEVLLERHINQAEADRQQAQRDRQTMRDIVRELVENAETDRQAFIDSISENSERIDELTERFNRFVEQAAADRQQAALDRQEIRRIWEYLLTQSGNGHTPQ